MGELGNVAAIRRYPVKSMLGEDLQAVTLTASGLDGDRTVAVIDQQPAPQLRVLGGGDPAAGQVLSRLLHRDVRLATERPERAILARPAPEDVIDNGEDADVPYQTLEIGQGTPGSTFVDFAPVHLITSATLAHVGAEMIRYRPNIVVDTRGGAPFAENDWTGRDIWIGRARLRIILPTPRCAVPTLAHGTLSRRTDAVRTLLEHNRIPVPGHGTQPCLGAYAQVINAGTVSVGDRALFA